MSPTAVDNDVLIKTSCYAFDEELLTLYGTGIGVLDSAKYVVGDRLLKAIGINDAEQARLHWSRILRQVEELCPSEDEVGLATAMEDFALRNRLQLDGGESLLFAIAIHRGLNRIVTGDKRAIQSLEVVLHESGLEVGVLQNRLVCFEQLLVVFLEYVGADEARRRVCSEPDVDKTASICFSCTAGASSNFDTAGGLDSYIRALRAAAPLLLSVDPMS